MHKAVDNPNSAIAHTYPEILGSAGWGMLCYSETPMVNTLAGEVICRQTQSLFLSRIARGNQPNGYTGHAFYSGAMNCTGDEESLSDCAIDLTPSGWCPGKYTIVDCTPGESHGALNHSLKWTWFSVYLLAGVPDLVPDLYRFRRSLEARYWIDRIPLYYLGCAKEEGCLSSSANDAEASSVRQVYTLCIH